MTKYICMNAPAKTDISLRSTRGLKDKRLTDAVLFNHVASPRPWIDSSIERAFTMFVEVL